MGNWDRVKWTEAGQIAEILAWPGDLEGQARATPEAYFARLRQEGRLHDAAFFLGQALPRYETVLWAARVVHDLGGAVEESNPDHAPLTAAIRWVEDPSESRRRAAFAAASGPGEGTPARMAALAAFFSGGSMSPEGQPPVPPPRDAAGRFAAGAVVLAAIGTGDQAAALAKALAVGDAIASQGAPAV